jgi:hypothetical protein
LPPGGLLHKQGPRRARLRAAPLPHSHNALLATPCCCAPAGGPRRGPRLRSCVPACLLFVIVIPIALVIRCPPHSSHHMTPRAKRSSECVITAELSRSSAPRAAFQSQESVASGGFRETRSHWPAPTRMHGSAIAQMRELKNLLPRADHTEACAQGG